MIPHYIKQPIAIHACRMLSNGRPVAQLNHILAILLIRMVFVFNIPRCFHDNQHIKLVYLLSLNFHMVFIIGVVYQTKDFKKQLTKKNNEFSDLNVMSNRYQNEFSDWNVMSKRKTLLMMMP